MKKSSNFEPIFLKDAKKHIEWINSKMQEKSQTNLTKEKKPSFFSKVIFFLKKVF